MQGTFSHPVLEQLDGLQDGALRGPDVQLRGLLLLLQVLLAHVVGVEAVGHLQAAMLCGSACVDGAAFQPAAAWAGWWEAVRARRC